MRREMEARGNAEESHRHRIPLGLAMLEQGWITRAQLRGALEAQKAAGGGRLGQWLVRQQGVSEQLVTRALGLQWSCPVLGMETARRRGPDRAAAPPVCGRLWRSASARGRGKDPLSGL